jgi:transmembrane sensor
MLGHRAYRTSGARWVAGTVAGIVVLSAMAYAVHVRGGGAPQAVREFATAAGGRSTVTLRDGTRLVLGPATRVRVPADFGRGARMVELDGEAYFAVVHNAAQPFAVRTVRAEVRDVGTTFSVRAYADDADGRVAVTEGEVRVGTISLARGDLALIDIGGRVAVRHGVDLTPYIAWTQGRLAFDGTPLRDVARELDRVFDVHITIADSGLAGDQVSGTFDNESVDQVLDDITDVIGGGYERVGRAVVIRRRTSRATRHGLGERLPMRMAQVTAPKE